jgi:hypothetical protein
MTLARFALRTQVRWSHSQDGWLVVAIMVALPLSISVMQPDQSR